MIPTFTTDRLTLRPLTLDDVPAIHAIFSNPTAMRYLPVSLHQDLQQTRAGMEIRLSRSGGLNWAICFKGHEQWAIGMVQYLGQTRFPEMGYVIHPDYWGQGLVVEACQAALDYGFTELGYDRVEFWIDETNLASLRVAEKLNFRVKGRVPTKYPHRPDFHFLLVYGMLAHEWLGASAPTTPRFFSLVPALMVPDIEAAIAFYQDMLGFAVEWIQGEPPQRARLSMGEWSGNMAVLELQVVLDGRPTMAGLTLHMDTHLDDWAALLDERGVVILEAPHATDWGTREFTIHDCNGVMVRFSTPR